ncbi:hypothetical protein K1719_041432 [Acacia pycnantha]|nr:hypothetical protein K1719_041432 [Acacia pycnantha]
MMSFTLLARVASNNTINPTSRESRSLLDRLAFPFRSQFSPPTYASFRISSSFVSSRRSSPIIPYPIINAIYEKLQGNFFLMDCSPRSSDRKTLKRWFFIDKRVG